VQLLAAYLQSMATSSDSATATEPGQATERAIKIPQDDAARAALIEKAKRIFKGEKIDDPNAIAAVARWKKKAYLEEFPEDIDEFRTLLQDYGKVPPDQVEPLLRDIVSSRPLNNPLLWSNSPPSSNSLLDLASSDSRKRSSHTCHVSRAVRC
jgi:hypothetical protein